MYKKFMKRFLPIALSVAMTVQMSPEVAFAAELGDVEAVEAVTQEVDEVLPDGVTDPSTSYEAITINDDGMQPNKTGTIVKYAIPRASFSFDDATDFNMLSFSDTKPTNTSKVVIGVKLGEHSKNFSIDDWHEEKVVGDFTYYYIYNKSNSGCTITLSEAVKAYTLTPYVSGVDVKYQVTTNAGIETFSSYGTAAVSGTPIASDIAPGTKYYFAVDPASKVRNFKVEGATKEKWDTGTASGSAYVVEVTKNQEVSFTADPTVSVTTTVPSNSDVTVSAIKVSSTALVEGKDPATSGEVTTYIKGDVITMEFDAEAVAGKVPYVTFDSKQVTPKTITGNKYSYSIPYTVKEDATQNFNPRLVTRDEIAVSVTPSGIKAYILDKKDANSDATKIKKSDFTAIGDGTKVSLDTNKDFYVYFEKNVTIETATSTNITADPTQTEFEDFIGYKVVVDDSTTSAAIAVKVENETDIKVNGDDHVEGVVRSTSDDSATPSFGTTIKVANNSTVTVKQEADKWVWFQYSFKDNFEFGKATIGTTAVSSDAITAGTVITVDGYQAKVITAGTGVKVGVTATGSPVITVASKQSVVDQEFTTTAHTKVTVDKTYIVDTTGDAVTVDQVATGAGMNAFKALKGEKISFTVDAEDGYKVASVEKTSDETTIIPVKKDGKLIYTVTAGDAVTLTEATVSYTVTLDKAGVLVSSLKTLDYDFTDKDNKSTASGSAVALSSLSTYNNSLALKVEANDGYVVKTVKYGKDGKWTVASASNNVYNIGKITEDITVKIITAEDESKLSSYKVTFDKAYVKVTETKNGTLESGKEFKTSSPAAIKVSTMDGYESVITCGTTTQAAVGANVDFSITKGDVTITTTPKDLELKKDRFVEFISNSDIDKFEVQTSTNLVDKLENGAYQIDKSVKEVTVVVTLKAGEKYADTHNFWNDGYACTSVETKGYNTIYTLKVPMTNITSEDERTPTSLTLPAADSSLPITVNWTGTLKSVHVNNTGTTWTPGMNYVDKGDRVVIELYDGYSLYKVGEATDTEDQPLTKLTLTNNRYAFTVTEPITLVAKLDKELGYVTKINDGTSPATTVEAKAGDSVEIEAYTEDATHGFGTLVNTLKKPELTNAASSTAIVADTKDKVTVNIAAADAGKEIKVKLLADTPTTDGAVEETVVGEVTIKVAAMPKGVTVKNGKTTIKNKGTLKLNAVNTAELDVAFTPKDVEKSYYTVAVETGKNVTAEFDKDMKKIIIKTGSTAEEAKIVIKDNTKTEKNELFTFTVKTVVPELQVKSLDSTAQGTNNVNLVLKGDAKLVAGLTTGKSAYYKVTVAPAKTSKVGKAAPSGSTYTYYIPFAAEATYKAVVNSATDVKNAAWTYDFEATMIVANIGTEAGSTAPSGIVLEGKKSVKKSFNTKNAYYEDKLTIAKKTVNMFNGQADVLVGIVKFSKNASYLTLKPTATILNADGSAYTGDALEASVDATGNITVTAYTDCKAGKYQIMVRADSEDGMYASTATLPITVKSGQYNFAISAPSKLVVAGKNATAKLSATAYDKKWDKSAVQKFNYELVRDYYGNPLDATTDQNVIKNVSIKNGTLTIKKSFEVSPLLDENMVYVKVSATDYTGNLRKEVVGIEITKEAMALSDIKIYDWTASKYVEASETLSMGRTYIVYVFDKDGNDVTNDVTLTPAYKYGTNSIDVTRLYAYKAGKMTIKATTTDGSKKSISKNVTFAYKTFTDMKVVPNFYAQNYTMTSANSYKYDGVGNGAINFSVCDGKNTANGSYSYSCNVKGAKWADGYGYVPTAKTITITVKDLTNKKAKPLVVTIENTNPVLAKAPKVTMTNKIYTALYDTDNNAVAQNGTFKVASSAYDAVKVTHITGTYDNGYTRYLFHSGDYSIDTTTGTFTVGSEYKLYPSPVREDYQMEFGTYDEYGTFVAQTLPTTVTVKSTKSDATKFKVNKTYTITPSDSVSTMITGKPAEIKVAYTGLENANVKGASNSFTKLFSVAADGTLTYNTSDAKFADLIKDKNNFTGYVNYYYYTANGKVSKSEKITVKINSKDKKYTADAATTIQGKAVTTVVRSGKTAVDVKTVKSTTEGWTATLLEDGKISLVSTTAVGKCKVTFKVIPTTAIAGAAGYEGIEVAATVNVLDPAKANKKLTVKKNATTIDLAKASIAEGKYTYSVAATSVYSLVNGVVVKAIKADDKAPEGITVALSEGNIVITADPTKVAEKKTYKVNAVVTFENSTVDEIIALTVKTPVYATFASTQADIEKALASVRGADTDAIKTMLTGKINPLTGITVESVTSSVVTATVSGSGTGATIVAPKYTICAKIKPASGDSVAVTKEVKAPLSDSMTIADALADAVTQSDVTPSAIGIRASELTTKLAVQKYFEQAVFDTDTKVEVNYFYYDPAVDGTAKRPAQDGCVRFRVKLYNGDTCDYTTTKEVTIKAKE